MKALVKSFEEVAQGGAKLPTGWRLKLIVNDDNLTYLALCEPTREAIWVDPVREDLEVLHRESRSLAGYRFVAVIDTHTHADHISSAAELADFVRAPLVMQAHAPSPRVHLRISRDTVISTAAGPLEFLLTPGHTWDCMVPFWGPFFFGGDTLLHGDCGRDDLPTGDPEAHYDSLQKIKARAKPDQFMLPGHDSEGGRITTWAEQLKLNPALAVDRATFVREWGGYVGPAPKLLKESLFENFK